MSKITWVFQDERGDNLNRYIATNVSTGEKITFDLLRGGNISVVGTPLNASNLNGLITAINDNYDEIVSLKDRTTTLESDVSSLKTSVSTNTSNISANASSISQLQSDVSKNAEEINDRVNILEDSVNANAGEISNLNDRIDDLENLSGISIIYTNSSASNNITLSGLNNSLQPNKKYYIQFAYYEGSNVYTTGGITFVMTKSNNNARYMYDFINFTCESYASNVDFELFGPVQVTGFITSDYSAFNTNSYSTKIELKYYDILEKRDVTSTYKTKIGIHRIYKI